MTLSEDQRYLLLGIGGWPIVGALGDPEYGIPHLFDSWASATFLRAEALLGRPTWKGYGYQTKSGKVAIWTFHDAAPIDVSVSKAQLAKYASTIPKSVVVQLQAVSRALVDEQGAMLRVALQLEIQDEPTDLLELLAGMPS